MKEIKGAKKGDNKARLCWCESKRISEKRCIFFVGRGVFLLAGPLMTPFHSYEEQIYAVVGWSTGGLAAYYMAHKKRRV
jgi:hypothetical protein